MFFENPYLESIDNWLTVWLGNLNADELEAYLAETGGSADDEPISKFSFDLGTWYDHDFIWAEGVENPISISELCARNDIGPGGLEQEIRQRSPFLKTQSLLILWNSRRLEKVNSSRLFAGGRLKCIGSWSHPSPLTD